MTVLRLLGAFAMVVGRITLADQTYIYMSTGQMDSVGLKFDRDNCK